MSHHDLPYRPTSPCYCMSANKSHLLTAPHAIHRRNLAARRRVKGCVPMSRIWLPLIVAATLGLGPCLAEGKLPLPQETHINEQLVAAAAGDILRKTCPTLKAQRLVVLSKLAQLQSYTRAKGYTEAEVRAFLKDRTQKDRIKASARDYLAKSGVIEADKDSYCKAGRNEIAKGTLVGTLLWSSQ